MRVTSIVAIYFLIWVMSAFLVLPFGVRNHAEEGTEPLPGQDHGAPANFRPLRTLRNITILATVLFAAFYLNYVNGWIGAEQLNLFSGPPDPSGNR